MRLLDAPIRIALVYAIAGYADGEIDSDSSYLLKPFTAAELLTSIRRLLAQPQQGQPAWIMFRPLAAPWHAGSMDEGR